VHGLPVVTDLRARFPQARIDWVVEESYAEIPRLHPAVGRIIPCALRRWRKSVGSRATLRELASFLRLLRAEAYDYVIDLQGLMKSALIVRAARLSSHGQRCGYASEAAREPLAAFFYQRRFVIPKSMHAVLRNRWLAAAALDYELAGALDYGIAPSISAGISHQGRGPTPPYAVLLTASSRRDKRWSEQGWFQLAAALSECGLDSILPSGTDAEREDASQLAAGMTHARVAPPSSITELARLFANAQLVVGVDTGLTHLAAAIGKPTLALFVASDPKRTGVYAEADVLNLGGNGAPPEAAVVIEAAQALLVHTAVRA
jgi:heptosyltransferase-1